MMVLFPSMFMVNACMVNGYFLLATVDVVVDG